MTDNKYDWINVHYEDVKQSKNHKKSGVTIRFMISPLDIPEMWRHSINETFNDEHEAIFEFKYLASKEPSRTLKVDGIKLEVGKNSHRVYRIIIPLTSDTDELEVKIEAAIKGIETLEEDKKLRATHASVIQDMLRQPGLHMAL